MAIPGKNLYPPAALQAMKKSEGRESTMTTIELTGTDIDISEVNQRGYFTITQEKEDKQAHMIDLSVQDIPKIIEALITVDIVKMLQTLKK